MKRGIEKDIKKDSVIGIFQDRSQAEMAVQRLKAAGFPGQDISVLFPNKSETRDFVKEEGTKAPEDALKGAGVGGVLGGLTGWLAGIGVLAIPGLGPFIAAGPIMGLLSGAAIGGTIGGAAGALIGMGVPEETARRYELGLKEGRILIAVHSHDYDERIRARQILQECGATDITMTGESSATGTAAAAGARVERAVRDAGQPFGDRRPNKKEEGKETYRDVRNKKIS